MVPVCKKGDKTDCTDYQGISILSATYKILPSSLLSILTLYVHEITEDHQCGFRRGTSATNRVFCIVTRHLLTYAVDIYWVKTQHLKLRS